MNSAGYEACDMSHIYHEICSYFLSNLTECLEVKDPGVSRCACKDQLRLAFMSKFSYVVHIDISVFVYIIEYHVVEFAGEVNAGTVGQMSAVVQVKAKDRIAGFEN